MVRIRFRFGHVWVRVRFRFSIRFWLVLSSSFIFRVGSG